MLRTNRTIAQYSVEDAGVVRILGVALDALTDKVTGDGVGSAFGVVLAVRIVGAAEVRLADVPITMVTRVANADVFVSGCGDAMRVRVAGAAPVGPLDAFVTVAFVSLETSTFVDTTALGIRTHGVGWAILVVTTLD